jgi:large subunit ribosomal protein L37e
MTKGTSSMGKHNSHSHGLCPRSGTRSLHLQKKKSGRSGFPNKKLRKYQWSKKAIRRKTTGTGRCRHLKTMARRFKNGFREGTTPAPRKKNRSA